MPAAAVPAVMPAMRTIVPAVFAVFVRVMRTVRLARKFERARKQGGNAVVRTARSARIYLDARLRERGNGAAADAAAHERFHAALFQKACESAVAEPVGRYDFSALYFTVFRLINFEKFAVPEMLKKFHRSDTLPQFS